MRKIESLRECLSDQAASKKHDQYCSAFFLFMDVSNAAGHRLSTEAIEEIIAAHPNVAECAVIGASDKLKGDDVPLALVVLKTGTTRPHQEIAADLIAAVWKIGPVASFKLVKVVNRLPKPRSGKIVRRTIEQIADGVKCDTPATIEDSEVLEEIKALLVAGASHRQ